MDYTEAMTSVMSLALIGIGAVAIYARLRLRWVEGKLRRLELLEDARSDRVADPVSADRLTEIEAGLDRLEARLDQLAEGQEFLGRVLADRAMSPPRRDRQPGEPTPH